MRRILVSFEIDSQRNFEKLLNTIATNFKVSLNCLMYIVQFSAWLILSQTLNLLPCSPTDGLAKIFSPSTLAPLEHHFNMSVLNEILSKLHLKSGKRFEIVGVEPRPSHYANDSSNHWTMLNQVQGYFSPLFAQFGCLGSIQAQIHSS